MPSSAHRAASTTSTNVTCPSPATTSDSSAPIPVDPGSPLANTSQSSEAQSDGEETATGITDAMDDDEGESEAANDDST